MTPTPTSSLGLPIRIGTFDTLAEALDYAARGDTGVNFFGAGANLAGTLSYRDLRERACDLAARLAGAGFARGSRMALIAETTPDFFVFFYACQYAGLVPVPLPVNLNLGGHSSYVARLRGMLQSSHASAVMGSAELVAMIKEAAEGLDVRMVGTADDFRALPVGNGGLQPLAAGELSYIQYSSGSTTAPRGVLVSQRAISANARAILRDGLKFRAGDRATSWLPLYHDMGLVGFCIAPMFAQASVDYIPTTTFGMRPLTWLKVLSDHGGTISFGPTFGYDLCVRRAANGLKESPDLSRWRVAGVGGEMVRADVLERFAERFGPLGFDRRAFVPSFGLAEATLAVTFTPLGEGVRVDRVDRTMYELTRRAVPVASDDDQDARKTRSFAYCGRPMPEYRIEIRDDNGRVLPERVIGRVLVTGPSLMDGYFANDEMTRQVLVGGGWLDTGDMGYLTDGYLVITGRRKDLIICKGRNIWPQDLEWVVETMPGVRTGSVAAFSVADGDDGERVVVVVESYTKQVEERAQLVRDIGAAINRTAGVSCEVVPVPARTLPYTSSGKLSRAAVKALYQQGLSWPDDPGEAPVVAQQRPRVAAAAAGG